MGRLLERKLQKKSLTYLGSQDGFEIEYTKQNADRGSWTREGSGDMFGSWLLCVLERM